MNTREPHNAESDSATGWDAEASEAHGHLLRAAARCYCLNRLYVGTAHELKSPLNSMVMNVEVLRASLEAMGDSAKIHQLCRYAQALTHEVERLNQQLHLLLALIAPPDDIPTRINFAALLQSVTSTLAPQAKQQRVSVEVDSRGEAVSVVAVQSALVELLNLLSVHLLSGLANGGSIAISVVNDDAGVTVLLVAKGTSEVRSAATIVPPVVTGSFGLDEETTRHLAVPLLHLLGGALELDCSAEQTTAYRLTLPVSQES